MKLMKFLVFSLLSLALSAQAKVNLSLGLVRNDVVTTAANIQLDVDQRELCYRDENTYIEAELLEENADNALVQFTIATKNETGAFMVRGLPKLQFIIDGETKVATSSLRADSQDESFNLIVTLYKIDEATPVVAAIE